ncbi:thiamine phosphate synthase [Lentibacillus jeotgali]|uniref:thiamine phosphate synthase n=1 Tax=Lentibacillus jeotgali TaxID=558169 RepID=UPI0002627832
MTELRQRLRKYFIMGSQNCEHHPVETLEKAIQSGITAFQFREKGIVAQLDADGIHVGQDDMPVGEIRKRLPHKLIGLSVSTNQELNESPIESVDYFGAGPIFSTTTKETVKIPAIMPDWLLRLGQMGFPLFQLLQKPKISRMW